MPEFGKLSQVDLREAWAHEAHDFTPWLAEHLDELSEAVGIAMEAEDTEVAVESFSADILARNPHDDTRILIENQLEKTDHAHLGQIMTYLAGLEAKIIIWVAADFREPHLSALRWLNENTPTPFAFFAVQVRVVRIADSPMAPIFEVVERPNQWERHLHAEANPETSQTNKNKEAFWKYYIEQYPEEEKYGLPTSSSRWHTFPNSGLVVSIYAGVKKSGLFIRGKMSVSSIEVGEILSPHREALDTILGSDGWDEVKGYYYHQKCVGSTNDESTWPAMAAALHDLIVKTEDAIRSCFGEAE